jgi:surface polysaccharide O-acyltransferase-like enzyme
VSTATKERSSGIDLVKSLAVFFVVCVHFSLNTRYYETPVAGSNMLLQTVLRWLFVSCVPLFLLATGYLSGSKTALRGYYPKILRVLVPYLVISILCLIVNSFRYPGQISLKGAVFEIFSFKADPYAWYVNMYLGLFLLAPFLSRMLEALDKKAYHVLFAVLVVIVLLPATFNPIFSYREDFAFFYFPDFWASLYPLFYFAAGAYIRRFRPAVKPRRCLLAVAVLIALQTAVLILARPYLVNNWLLTAYGSVFIAAESVALFLLLYRIDIKSAVVRRILSLVSSVTLEIYLFSYLADSTLYPLFYRLSGEVTQQAFFLKFFALIVPLVFLSSLVPALLLHGLYAAIERAVKKRFSGREKLPAEAKR